MLLPAYFLSQIPIIKILILETSWSGIFAPLVEMERLELEGMGILFGNLFIRIAMGQLLILVVIALRLLLECQEPGQRYTYTSQPYKVRGMYS